MLWCNIINIYNLNIHAYCISPPTVSKTFYYCLYVIFSPHKLEEWEIYFCFDFEAIPA